MALDTREIFNRPTELTFIDPFTGALDKLRREDDWKSIRVIRDKVQDVSISLFAELQENDILFIDSSHVAKCGSDVCYEIFEILPNLQHGVLVHFHDCFWPFEYPRSWAVNENRAWNELYFLRAFLMYNPSFRVLFFNHYFALKYPDEIAGTPLAKNPGGALWLRKDG